MAYVGVFYLFLFLDKEQLFICLHVNPINMLLCSDQRLEYTLT